MSSTFSDLRAEREALQANVFPRLHVLCQQNGCRFQAVDLRWGVSKEAGQDQKTITICLDEIERCRTTSPRPNFIVLLGDRYGWCPLPPTIPASELLAIRDVVSAEEGTRLDEWYRLDANAVPSDYVLRPRTDAEEPGWPRVEHELRSIFVQAIGDVRLANDARIRYEKSATEQEIYRGVLQVPDAREHVFCFFRTIDDVPVAPEARDFVDLHDDGDSGRITLDAAARARLVALKEKLTDTLPGNIRTYRARWTGSSSSTDHLERLCDDVFEALSNVIAREIAGLRSVSPADREIEAHEAFGDRRSRDFVGRDASLSEIRDYLTSGPASPLFVVGPQGSGKSALLARATRAARSQLPNADVIARFIGATPDSSSGRTLLETLCAEVSQRHGEHEPAGGREYRELARDVPRLLGLATAERPLALFIDALDQLADDDQARSLSWLPRSLPDQARVILSTTTDDWEAQRVRFSDAQIVNLLPMSGEEADAFAQEALDRWLAVAGRTLEPGQREYIIRKFRSNGLPLYLRLAFEEARRWTSPPREHAQELADDVDGIVARNLLGRLSSSTNHGPLLVARSLGYLAAAKNGLAEDELLALLSSDDTLMSDIRARAHHPLDEGDTLPVVLWSRLYFDLEPYLSERSADGAQLLTFYHRQVRDVVASLFLGDDTRHDRHRTLGRYFAGQPLEHETPQGVVPNLRTLSELPYQLANGAQWTELAETLCDFGFLQAKARHGRLFDLLADFERGLALMPDWSDSRRELRQLVSEFARAVNQEFSTLRDRPHSTAQQLYNNLRTFARADTLVAGALEEFAEQGYPGAGTWLRRLNRATRTAASRGLLRTVHAHDGAATALAVSRDGRHIASAGVDGRIRVWQSGNGQLVADFSAGEEDVTALAWPGAEVALLLSGGASGVVREWDWRAEQQVRSWTPHTRRLRDLVVAGDQETIATCADDGLISTWSRGTASEMRTLVGHEDRVVCLAAGNKGSVLVSGSCDSYLKIWDVQTSSEVRTLLGHIDNVRSVAVNADGTHIVSGADDATLKLWDVAKGQVLRTIRGAHGGRIMAVAFLPLSEETDGVPCFASAGEDGMLKLWDSRSGRVMVSLRGHVGAIYKLAVNAVGRRCVTAGHDGTIRFWDTDYRTADEAGWREHNAAIRCMVADPVSGVIVSGADDRTVRVWNGQREGSHMRNLRGHGEPVTCVAHLGDDQVASGSLDRTIRVWNAGTGALVATLGSPFAEMDDEDAVPDQATVRKIASALGTVGGHKTAVTGVAPAGAGRLVSSSRDGSVRLWDIPGRRELKAFDPAAGGIETLVVSQRQQLAAGGGPSGVIHVWDLERTAEVRQLRGHSSGITALAILGDDLLVSGSRDRTVRVWSLSSGAEGQIFEGHRDWVTCLDVDARTGLIASGSRDADVRVWVADGPLALKHVLSGHTQWIKGVLFDKEESTLYSFAVDSHVIAWNIDTGHEVVRAAMGAPLDSLCLAGPRRIGVGTHWGGLAVLDLEHTHPLRRPT